MQEILLPIVAIAHILLYIGLLQDAFDEAGLWGAACLLVPFAAWCFAVKCHGWAGLIYIGLGALHLFLMF